MKTLVKIVLAIMIISAPLVSCKKSSNHQQPPKSGFTVMSNGNDPLIATYSDAQGSTIDFFGTRDIKGTPLLINQIVVRKNTDTTIYKIDELGRPVTAIAPNGVQFQFNWSASQKAALTIITKDGKYQVNTDVDFSKMPNSLPVIKTNNTRRRQNAGIVFSAFGPVKPKTNAVTSTDNNGNALVNVTACGLPDDGLQVNVLVNDESGHNLGYFPAYPNSNGAYIAHLPTTLAPKINLKEICENVSSVLEKACWATEVPGLTTYLCAAATVATAEVPPAAVVIATACTAISTGLELYCSTIGASPAEGAPSLADFICNAPALDRTITSKVVVFASVVALPQNVNSLYNIVEGTGPFPDMNIELNTATTIRSLVLNPPSPAAKQGYVATADIYCLQSGSAVTLSIAGTDGYTDSETMTISDTEKSGQFTLSVPGAATAGIQDVVTLSISLPNGETITRTAQLVFN